MIITMDHNSIVIRKIENADFWRLVNLYDEVWPEVSYDKEKKANFVLNESRGIRYCAEINGEIVGSRVSFYMNCYYGTKKLSCIQVGDTCTRKDCRGKGLLAKMSKALLKDFFQDSQGDLIWNISVEATRKGNEKLGWVYINSLATLVKVCRPFHIISSIGMKLSSLKGVVNWDLDDEEIDIKETFLEGRECEINKKELIHVKYDKETIQWRLKTQSGIKAYEDKDKGTVLYKKGTKNGLVFVLIGEVFAKQYDEKTIRALLKGLKRATNADLLKTAVSMGHPMLLFYKKAGFVFNPRKKYLDHGVKVESEEMKRICYNPQNWAISMLDVDTF